MADIGKSQVRQVGNLGNTPAGQTGYPTGSSGNAYYEFGSVPYAAFHPSKNVNTQSAISPAGAGSSEATSGHGNHYYRGGAPEDPSPRRPAHSGGLFGGKTGPGATQADTGPLPIPTTGGSSLVTHFLMRARDPDCVSQPTYVYWAVINTPDTTGAQYTGSRCGIHALVDIVVEITWKQ